MCAQSKSLSDSVSWYLYLQSKKKKIIRVAVGRQYKEWIIFPTRRLSYGELLEVLFDANVLVQCHVTGRVILQIGELSVDTDKPQFYQVSASFSFEFHFQAAWMETNIIWKVMYFCVSWCWGPQSLYSGLMIFWKDWQCVCVDRTNCGKWYTTDSAAAMVLVGNLQVKPEMGLQDWSLQNTLHRPSFELWYVWNVISEEVHWRLHGQDLYYSLKTGILCLISNKTQDSWRKTGSTLSMSI